MNKRSTSALATFCLAFAVQSGAADDAAEGGQGTAGDPSAGEALYLGQCKSCHGPGAKGMASFPKLVGNEAGYIVGRLEQYRAGEKVGPNTALMSPQAANLSDEDIAHLAAYVASLGG